MRQSVWVCEVETGDEDEPFLTIAVLPTRQAAEKRAQSYDGIPTRVRLVSSDDREAYEGGHRR